MALKFLILIFVEGGKPENPEKNPQSKARTNNKLNPHMTPGPGFEPGPNWCEASALTTAPTLLSRERRSLRCLDVMEKVLFNDLVLTYKCVNGLAPDYLGKYFVKCSAVHNRNTRGCNNFVIPRCRLSMGQRAFYYRGPLEWNGLPDYI